MSGRALCAHFQNMARPSLFDVIITIDQSPLEPRLKAFLKQCLSESKDGTAFNYAKFGLKLALAEEPDRPVLTVFIRSLVQ
jgi:hypothetical protein